MEQGQLIEQGAHEELLTLNRIYARFWRVQSGVHTVSSLEESLDEADS
jgi:hypothetical protein